MVGFINQWFKVIANSIERRLKTYLSSKELKIKEWKKINKKGEKFKCNKKDRQNYTR